MRNNNEQSLFRLNHILRALNAIETYMRDVKEDEFTENEMLLDAVLLQFIIIGEAIVHIGREKLDKYDYPWFKVRAFRNFIAHEYFEIKPGAVWKIIRVDLPELRTMIETVIRNEF
jgi:uncharacterized protein with HEPN domain